MRIHLYLMCALLCAVDLDSLLDPQEKAGRSSQPVVGYRQGNMLSRSDPIKAPHGDNVDAGKLSSVT
jgi:hypothetical protein